jgi:hypothetical protein
LGGFRTFARSVTLPEISKGIPLPVACAAKRAHQGKWPTLPVSPRRATAMVACEQLRGRWQIRPVASAWATAISPREICVEVPSAISDSMNSSGLGGLLAAGGPRLSSAPSPDAFFRDLRDGNAVAMKFTDWPPKAPFA